jgi:hypothetical protein
MQSGPRARERSSQAEVDTPAEGHLMFGLAVDVEDSRVGEHPLVAIG